VHSTASRSIRLAERRRRRQQHRPSNYKTVLCKSWQIKGEYAPGNLCNFAHCSEAFRPSGASPAPAAKGERKKTAADVDRMVE